jgi:dTMP kinase
MENEDLKNKLRGKFIVLDGPDGCGKTTQAKLLTEWLQSEGVPTSSFRDPGDTPIGEKIRQILLSPAHIAMSTRTEMLLYMAARAQLWQEKMVPAFRDNHCVILDRWVSSTCAYQGNAGDFGMQKVIKLATDCLARPWPDLTIILDVDVKTGFKRLPGKLDRMEAKGREYHQKVREGFLKLASQQENFVVIDASGSIEEVNKKIIGKVKGF